jgi:lipoprotein signal peptidase
LVPAGRFRYEPPSSVLGTDRIIYGKVIDFMNVGLGPVRTGIFNVADMAIMLGAAIVVGAGYYSDGRAQMRASD